MIKISIDFDGTLSEKEVQDFALTLMNQKNAEVWIVTRRYEKIEDYTEEIINQWKIKDLLKEFNYLFEVANKIGIPRERIIFTNMQWKYFTMNKEKFHVHIDDDPTEISLISTYSPTTAIRYRPKTNYWKDFINKVIGMENN